MKKHLENIAIIGAGGLGSVYMSIFYELCAESVCFIAGGGRYDRLQRHGVVVNGKRYGIAVVKPEDATPADLLIVAVYDIAHRGYHAVGPLLDKAFSVGKKLL
jgi:2-dehydropantoate 2-reductase